MNKALILILLYLAVIQAANINFDISGNNESYCVRYAPDQSENCIAIGDLDRDSFDDLNVISSGQLRRISHCRAYTNDGHCEFCDPGYAYNGKSCQKCTNSRYVEASAISCDFNWKEEINGKDCGAKYNMINGEFERCLKRKRLPKMTAPLWPILPRGRMWMWRGSRWGTGSTLRNCNTKNTHASMCNCFSSFHLATCGKCKEGYTLTGYHENTRKWIHKSIEGDKKFTGYRCVNNSEINVPNCDIFSPADNFGGMETCIRCDYTKGYRMTSDYMCDKQEIGIM